jgi:hypothetical protein
VTGDTSDPESAPERLRAILSSEHGVGIGPITASKIVEAFLNAEPVDSFEMSDRNGSAVLTWSQMRDIVQRGPSLEAPID